MNKKILGLTINVSEIGWALIAKYVSDFPEFPKPENVDREIKEDKYIVDAVDGKLIVFKIFSFADEKSRNEFKEKVVKQYPWLIGADSKPETKMFYTIISDIHFDPSDANYFMTRAIYAMDWFIEVVK
jgi:hypothetical protein